MEERRSKTRRVLPADSVVVSAVVATFNEEQHIGTCLENLLNQQSIQGEIEILVVDGMSTDRTRAIVRSFPEYGTKIRLVENANRHQAYAWNLALREMRGEYFAMITAHAEYAPDYFARCLETMRRTGATAVGGVPRAFGEGALGQAIAWCVSSPAGIGGARFRYANREEECSTVPLIFTRRDVLIAAGGYNERVVFDEDSEMNYRLRARGARFIVTPSARVRYHVRRTLRGLSKQMFRYGYSRRMTQLLHPKDVPLRIYAPPALVAGLAVSALLACTPARAASVALPLVYAAYLLMATSQACLRIGAVGIICAPALVTMHVSYGCGFWRGVFSLPAD